ncbi:MAG: oligosaccharide flippase family protein [Parachlamydia sp.]|nr:oligosaccharide flippase family protein [Parachlamydia sp.]
MQKLLNRLLSGSVLYGFSSMLLRAVMLLLLPVYTKYLSPSDFGNFQFVVACTAFAKLLINLGLTTSFWKFYTKEGEHNGRVLVNIIFCQLTMGLFFLAIGYFVHALFIPRSDLFVFMLILLAGEVLGIFYDTTLLLLRAHDQPIKYLIVALSYALVFFASSLVLIVVLQQNYGGAIYAYSAAYAFMGLVLYMFLRRKFRGSFDIPLIKEIISYGFPIMLANLAAVIVALSDRPILKLFVDDSELGLYSFGFKLGDIVKILLITPFFLAWNPVRWEIYRNQNGRQIFSNIYKLLFFALSFLGLFVVSCAPLLCLIFASNKDYYEGLAIAPIIGLGSIFYGLYYYNAMGMLFENQTKRIFMVVIAASVVNIALNFILIPVIGMHGAAISSCVSYFVMYVLAVVLSQQCYPVTRNYRFEGGCVGLLIIISASLSVAYSVMIDSFYWLTLVAFSMTGMYLIGWIVSGNIRFIGGLKKISNVWRYRHSI